VNRSIVLSRDFDFRNWDKSPINPLTTKRHLHTYIVTVQLNPH